MSEQGISNVGGLLTREEVAKRFSVSIESVKRLEKKGKLPRVQVGERSVRYRVADVILIENGGRVKVAK